MAFSVFVRLGKELMRGNDRHWSFEDAIKLSKSLKPLFVPDKKGKAHYSDTNFQLLGRIIENLTRKTFAQNCEELIIKPLQASRTYVYQDMSDKKPKPLFYKNKELHIPKAMTSFGPDGGIVSASSDMLHFIEAFFGGTFFPASYIEELRVWNRIFFPLESGIGIHRFKLPWIFNPFGKIPEMIGHSGLSGTLAYACPERKLFIAGTVNQIAYPGSSFKIMIKLIQGVLAN